MDFKLAFCLLLSASILRHVYLRKGIGVGHLTRVYGGTRCSLVFIVFDRGVAKEKLGRLIR